MTRASKLMPAMQHLADTYVKGDTSKVELMPDWEERDGILDLYIPSRMKQAFSDETIAYMATLGFHHAPYDREAKAEYGEGSFAHFYILL